MEHRKCPPESPSSLKRINVLFHDDVTAQTEQREELAALLRKYGQAWEPWKKELEKFNGKGQELLKATA